jgi:integrase
VRFSLWHGQLGTPKTYGSIRSIYPGPALMKALSEHRELATHNSPADFVFCRPDGTPLRPDGRDVLYPALDRLQIPRASRTAGFHTFRHSAASIVNAETGNLKLTQRLLGHASLSTTADIYTHTQASAEREATVALENAILGNLFQTVPQVARGTNSARVI